MDRKHTFFFLLCLLMISNAAYTQIDENRRFEAIIVSGNSLLSHSTFQNADISNLYLYAYDSPLNSWDVIPFQIDEVNPAVDDSVKYFIPEDSLGGLFDGDDELVFMASDLGDRADSSAWVDDSDTTRLEIEVMDPLNGDTGYAYLFIIKDSKPVVPTYNMQFDAVNDRVSSINYELGFTELTGDDINTTGLLNDVIIKSGSNQDIFDRQKIRAIGSWWILPVFLWEQMIFSHKSYAKVGPVRIIRNLVARFEYDLLDFNEVFTQTSSFYPWNGSFRLVDIPLGEAKDIGAEVDEVRISWDFNSNAAGMHFYSDNNPNGIEIDATPDAGVDKSLTPDELNWTMGTGSQGTMLNIFNVPGLGDTVKVYYHDASDGTVGDNSPLSVDTGDELSYGDNGFALIENLENYITEETSFSAIYYNFFLPPNLDPVEAAKMNEQLKFPVQIQSNEQTFSPLNNIAEQGAVPNDGYSLDQNYPNPFNSATIISFRIAASSRVSLKLYDTLGRLTRHLVNGNLNTGSHRYVWDGKDESGRAVPSGIYIYELRTDHFHATRKLLYAK